MAHPVEGRRDKVKLPLHMYNIQLQV